jgi:hypothetical protein
LQSWFVLEIKATGIGGRKKKETSEDGADLLLYGERLHLGAPALFIERMTWCLGATGLEHGIVPCNLLLLHIPLEQETVKEQVTMNKIPVFFF